MKLLVLSDLHVEFAPFAPDVAATQAADVVVLAGDIHKGLLGMAWARLTFPDKPIIYVAGNHEFYRQHWNRHLTQLRMEADFHSIHFLENDSVTIDGIRFLGATLWTNFEYFGKSRRSHMMNLATNSMNDFRLIEADPLTMTLDNMARTEAENDKQNDRIRQILSPAHTVLRHRESLAWLQTELENGDPVKTIVVTHHYPNIHSTAKQYVQDPLTAAFGSKLKLNILTQARLWIHGHTHDSCDYRLGDSKRAVRVVCNPRGYPLAWLKDGFENLAFNPGLLVEVGIESR